MAFHRLVVPTYFGGLPGGYDYINNPALNGDPGAASFTDGKKSSGPNQGTYLIAFGEDATSTFANRGLKALAENTDNLDNLLRRDIAVTARTADVTAGAPVSSLVIAGQLFVGEFGVANTQATRDLLISVLDNNDNEIITTAGVIVKALLIHDGASNNVVGTQTSGFFTSPTVNLNVPIPAGVTYRVYYGERTNLATLPKDAFTNIKIRGAQEVSGEVERVLRDLHTDAGGAPTWNGPWLATIASLARTGLDGRYRLSATNDPGFAMDTPGNGGFIVRDGPAIQLRAPTYLLDTVGTVGLDKYPDPLFAMLRMLRVTPTTTTTFDATRGGDHGLVQESPYHNTADANEVASGHVTGPLLLDAIPRNIAASTLAGHAVLTRISSAAVATVNPDSLTDTTSRRTIQVGGSDFVRDGSSRTALRTTDYIEVISNATGQVVGTYRVDSVLSATRFTVKALTGAAPPLGPSGSSAAVRLRWLQPTISIGGTYRAAQSGSNQATPHFMVAAPGLVHSDYDDNNVVPYASFLAASSRRDLAGLTARQALAWGGFNTTGLIDYNGFLYGDGSISVIGGRQRFSMLSIIEVLASLTGGATGAATVNINPLVGSNLVVSFVTAPSVASAITLQFDAGAGYSPTPGDELSVSFIIPDGTTGPLSVVWSFGSTVKFQLADDGVLPTTNSSGADVIVRYKLTYSNYIGWRAVRTDWEA